MTLSKIGPQTWHGALSVLLVLMCMIGLIVAQEAKKAAKEPVTPKVDKALPEEIVVADVRKDKVELLQAKIDNVNLKEEKLIEQMKKTPEWQALEAEGKDVASKLEAELISTLKTAGVEEKDFRLYIYDQKTLKFTKKKPETPIAEPKK